MVYGSEVGPNVVPNLKTKNQKHGDLWFFLFEKSQLVAVFEGKKNKKLEERHRGKKCHNLGLLLYEVFIGDKAKRILLRTHSTFFLKTCLETLFFLNSVSSFHKCPNCHCLKAEPMTYTCFLCMKTVPTGQPSLSSGTLRRALASIRRLRCLEVNRSTLFLACQGSNQVLQNQMLIPLKNLQHCMEICSWVSWTISN